MSTKINVRSLILPLLKAGGPTTVDDLSARTMLPLAEVQAELRRFCELGAALGTLHGTRIVYRLNDGETVASIAAREAKVAGLLRSLRAAERAAA